jgi:hypothetical protein
MEWKGSGSGVSEGLVVENRTGEPKHIEVDCQTSKSTVFSGVTRLDPGEVVPYSDLPDRMIQVNVRAADGPKGRKMFDPEAVSGAIVVQVTDAEVAFETTTEPYDPAMRDYTPTVDDDEGDNGGESDGSDDSEPSSDDETGNGSEPSSDDSDEKTADDGSTATTATGESAVSTTEQGQRDRTTTTTDRDAGRESSDDSSSVTGSQTTRSGSASETSARSGSETPETASDAAGEDTAGGADGRISETDRRPSQADTSVADADDTDGDEPGEGEIYCRSCGEIIRIKAELCPECGVRNVAQGMRGSSGRQPQAAAAGTTRGASRASSPGRTQPQQSAGGQAGTQEQTGSEPSGAWVNGVRIGGVLWLLVLGILIPTVMTYQNVTAGSGLDPGGMLRSLGLATLLPAVQLLAWVVLPVALYFDLKHIGYHVDEWPLNGRLYIAAALILPIFTQIFGAAALFVGSGSVVAAVIPVLMLGLCLRHLRTRSRLL